MTTRSVSRSGQINPFALIKRVWPDIVIYKQQKEIIKSVWYNRETIVPAGNMLGKDYIAALIALVFFLTRKQVRVVTTSVDSPQLEKVLWGEMKRFINSASMPLPIKLNHLDIRKLDRNGKEVDLTYLIGRTAKEPEGLLGHHLPWIDEQLGIPSTLMIYDEASSIPDELFQVTETWRHRTLAIGNCYPTVNYFYRSWKEGDIRTPSGRGIFRKVIPIRAEDSPNVRLGLKEEAAGVKPSHTVVIPGLKTYGEYKLNRELWDERRQCVSLDARFWEGDDVFMFTTHMLALAVQYADELEQSRAKRVAKGMGVDTAEGGDDSVWCITDEEGVIELLSFKTTKTSIIADMTIQLMKQYGLSASNVMFDRGGGGRQHADYLEKMGYRVRTIAFGGSVKLPVKRTVETFSNRKAVDEEKSQYVDNRAMMYGLLRDRMNPDLGNRFGIPTRYARQPDNAGLVDQLKPIPLLYDDKGRMILIPKGNQGKRKSGSSDKTSFMELIGRSPDQADALVMANYVVFGKRTTRSAGVY